MFAKMHRRSDLRGEGTVIYVKMGVRRNVQASDTQTVSTMLVIYLACHSGITISY
jgi:hypothetical protein